MILLRSIHFILLQSETEKKIRGEKEDDRQKEKTERREGGEGIERD